MPELRRELTWRRSVLLRLACLLGVAQLGSMTAALAYDVSEGARAFLIEAMRERDGGRRRALALRRIEALGSIERDGDLSDRLSLAAAIGVAARQTDPVESLRLRYGSRSIGIIRGVLLEAPDEPWALMMLGLWNIESLRRGGAVAGRLLGASENEGLESVAAARALAPEDPALHLAAAVAFASYDPSVYAGAARNALAQVQRLLVRAPDIERRVLEAAANPLSDALERGDFARARAFALQVM